MSKDTKSTSSEPLTDEQLDDVTGGTNAIIPPPAPGQPTPPPTRPPGPDGETQGSGSPTTPPPGPPGDVG